MNILAFADLRTTFKLPDVEPDLVLLLGDIPSLMVSRINKKYSCTKLGVLGNHCHPSNFDDTDIINMHEKIYTFKGVRVGGFEGSPRYKDRDFGQHAEWEAEQFVRSIGEQHLDILMTHSNPSYTDRELDHAHRGFAAFNDLIMNKQVTHLFHGHLHDPFQKQILDTTIHSVYPSSWIEGLSSKRKEVTL